MCPRSWSIQFTDTLKYYEKNLTYLFPEVSKCALPVTGYCSPAHLTTCTFSPSLQDAPIHATMVTLVVVSVDRYRRIVYPHKARLPPFIAVLGVWITSVCVVLPYAIYMNYIDLQVRWETNQVL